MTAFSVFRCSKMTNLDIVPACILPLMVGVRRDAVIADYLIFGIFTAINCSEISLNLTTNFGA